MAEPVFGLLRGNPGFLAARGFPRADVVLFALGITLAPPLVLYGLELLVGLASEPARQALHLLLVGLLAATAALQLVEPGGELGGLLLALATGAAAAAAYLRLAAARSLLTVLAPAPVVFLVLFLAFSDVAASDVGPGSSSRPPVLVLVLDELPLTSLQDVHGRVDARHFPNFARLAADATWYRNTTTVHADTPYAVPAIMDGRLPRKPLFPIAADHPRTIFSLLGGDYALHVREDATVVCPRPLCRDSRRGKPRRLDSLWEELGPAYLHELLPDDVRREWTAVSRGWREFLRVAGGEQARRAAARVRRVGLRRPPTRLGRKRTLRRRLNEGRVDRFDSFVDGIRGGGQPRLHFMHALLPHVPWLYLPSGRAYRLRASEEIRGLNTALGFHERFLVDQGWQRHLLQLGEVDRLLGRLLGRLKHLGVYDRALIAVVADHGASFQLNHGRRAVRPGNIEDIAPVPFFLKAPRQTRARISDKPLRTIDVLPTIADLLDVRIPWHVDGRSALRSTVPAQRHRRVIAKQFAYVVAVDDSPRFRPARRAVLRRKLSLFGSDLYAFGPAPRLLGRRVSTLRATPAAGLRARAIHPERFEAVDPSSGFLPSHLVGTIDGGVPGGGRVVAAAVNGRIEATGVTVSLHGTVDETFSLMLPERALRRGRNRVELLWLGEDGRIRSLGGPLSSRTSRG